MNFKKLNDYVEGKGKPKMTMAHIYQPVMIKALIQSNGKSTARKIAKEFLAKDESQIDYYTEKTKKHAWKSA